MKGFCLSLCSMCTQLHEPLSSLSHVTSRSLANSAEVSFVFLRLRLNAFTPAASSSCPGFVPRAQRARLDSDMCARIDQSTGLVEPSCSKISHSCFPHVWLSPHSPGDLGNLIDDLHLRNRHDYLQFGCSEHLRLLPSDLHSLSLVTGSVPSTQLGLQLFQ